MNSAMRPARLAVILGTVCALGVGAPAIALAAEPAAPAVQRDAGASEATPLTQFVSASGGEVACEDGTVDVSRREGDHFAMLEGGQAYTSLDYQADVQVTDGISAALVVGATNAAEPGSGTWYGFNFNNESTDQRVRLFRVNDSMDLITFSQDQVDSAGLDTTGTVHLRVQIDETGLCRVTASDAAGHEVSGSTTIQGWQGGSVGLLTFNSAATFSNVTISEDAGLELPDPDVPEEGDGFETNLPGAYATFGNGQTVETDKGLWVASSGGDYLVRWQDEAASIGDMVYSADVTFESVDVDGAASLVFHSDDKDLGSLGAYVANVNPKTGECRLFRFEQTTSGYVSYDMLKPIQLGQGVASTFHLSVTSVGKHMVYTVSYEDAEGNTVTKTASTADYTVGTATDTEEPNAYYGQNTALREGYCGVLSFNAAVTYQNLTATPLTSDNTTQLKDLNIEGAGVDMPFVFQSEQYVYIGYGYNEAESVDVVWEAQNADAKVTVTDLDGNVVGTGGHAGSVAVSLPNTGTSYRNEALNQYTVTVENEKSGARSVYQLRLFRENPADTYYNEDFRDQYHYSMKNGWGNDPCGMVRTSDGVYHFFYQYYSDTNWGPMHWGYATSTDLVHWEEQPVQMYPDEYGAQFSGCGVYATHETAPEIFDEGEEGLVFVITGNGRNGQDGLQRLTLAYATYDTETQTLGAPERYDDVLLDYSTDDIMPTPDGAFRDPKIFRFDNKWFLIVAGGPVRFYSSEDLVHWKGESYLTEPGTESPVYTECPNLYPVEAEDGTVKWVLSRGGRSYKLGEFKKVGTTNVKGGEYAFVQDPGTPDYTMNFGRDSYAAMTFFVQGEDFGTSGHVIAPSDQVAVNWMNTWDYNRIVDERTDNYVWSGTYNLFLEQGLKKMDDGTYRLVQTPVDGYEGLRDAASAVKVEGLALGGESSVTPLDFEGTSYEIEATFTPQEGTPVVGFDVRVGAGQKTRVSYDFATDTMTLDRSQSGVILNSAFAQNMSQGEVEHNADGSVTLHVYVDRMSVEVFTADYTVQGADQIFPSPLSDGLNAFCENGTATLDATVYPLDSIWGSEQSENPSSTPVSVGLSQGSAALYVGGEADVTAWVSPAAADQDLTLTVDNPSVADVEQTEGGFKVIGKAPGSATVTVTSAADPSLARTFEVNVYENNFQTNVDGLESPSGSFYVDGTQLHVDGVGANSFLFSSEKYPVDGLTYEIDVHHKTGQENLIFASQTQDSYQGCYAIQLDGAGKIRLFDFKGDKTLYQDDHAVAVAPDGTYHVKISVEGKTIKVEINGVQYLDYTLQEGDPDYTGTEGYVAIGMWDSDQTTFENFYVGGSATEGPAQDLQGAIDEVSKKVEGLDASDYTADSWAALQDALADARATLGDKNATSADMTEAAQAVRDAFDGLKKADAGEEPGGDDQQPGGGQQPGDDQRPGDTQQPGAAQRPGSAGTGSADGTGGTHQASKGSGELPGTGDATLAVGGIAALGAVTAGAGVLLGKARRR